METEPTPKKPRTIADLQPKMQLKGTVKETHLYGAMVDIGLEYDGMVHISQLAPTRVNRVTDVVEPGDEVTVWVTKVDSEKRRIGLSMVEPPEVEWSDLEEGQVRTGVVTRLEDYGAFVDIGAERAGLLHVREMADDYVRHPSEIVRVGDEIDVRIVQADKRKRRIDLSLMGTEEAVSMIIEEDQEPQMTAMEIALQRAQAGEKPAPRRTRKSKSSGPDLSEREDILARTLRNHSAD